MKKLLLTLIVSITLGGSVFAQGAFEWYWSKPMNGSSGQAALCAAIAIDGHVFTVNDEGWDQLEVAAFTGEVIRARDVLNRENVDWYDDPYPITNGTAVQYDEAGVVVSFKLYNHVNGVVYDICEVTYQDSPMTILTGQDHTEAWSVEPYDPIILNFTTPPTFSLPITGYGEGNEGNAANYYLIASPIGEVGVTNVTNMITEQDFDLYYFDQSEQDGLEWVNYKPEEASTNPEYDPAFTQLVAGKGYLYANIGDTTLYFTGTPFEDKYNVTDTTFALAYDGNAFWKGWNLVGNPFSVTAYIGDRAFYVMNEGGTDVEPAVVNGIPAMEGIFVVAEGENETVTFTTTAPNQQPALALNVSRDSKVVDRAIVGFGQERTLPKFQLNPNHTKVYIPQESRDYAVVTAEEMGEMPVGFKAEKNGSYTLDFTAQEVSFAYLHLIDNKTGKDVDLLESPAYSFDALTTDYASRFKLVFATGNATDDNFAFNSNGLWIISNEGEATLQVVDVTGRILSSETVSGCVSKAISAAPGVYMLRLINGDNMKVQKVVVK